MSGDIVRRLTPEEEELEKKKSELSELEAKLLTQQPLFLHSRASTPLSTRAIVGRAQPKPHLTATSLEASILRREALRENDSIPQQFQPFLGVKFTRLKLPARITWVILTY